MLRRLTSSYALSRAERETLANGTYGPVNL